MALTGVEVGRNRSPAVGELARRQGVKPVNSVCVNQCGEHGVLLVRPGQLRVRL
jgi:hypothetical protein